MADLSLTPVGTQVKPVQGMSLTDVINFARGAQEYGARADLIPQLLEQQKTATTTAKMDLARRQYQEIANANTALINDPLIVEAAESAGKGTPEDQAIQKARLTELVKNASAPIAKRFNIPQEQLDQSIAPIVQQIQQDPSQLRKRLIQLHTENLDEATKMGLFKGELQSVNTAEGTVLFERGYGAQRKQNEPVVFIPKNVPITERVKETTDAAGNPVYTIYDENGLPVRTNITRDQLGDTVLQRMTLEKQYQRVSPQTTGVETRAVSERLPDGEGVRAPSGVSASEIKTYQQKAEDYRASVVPSQNIIDSSKDLQQYLDKAFLGIGAKPLQDLARFFGIKSESAQEIATAQEVVGKKFADMLMQARQAGNTKLAADLELAEKAFGDKNMTREALQKIVNEFVNKQQHQLNIGKAVDLYIEKYPQFSSFVVPLIERAVNKVYQYPSLQILKIENDSNLSDFEKKKSMAKVYESYGIKKKEQFNELEQNTNDYQDLINGKFIYDTKTRKLVNPQRK